VIVTERTLVTFHSNNVCMVKQVMGPRLKSPTRDQLCSASYHQRLTRKRQVFLPKQYLALAVGVTASVSCVIKPPTPNPTQQLVDDCHPPTSAHSPCVNKAHTCPSWRRGCALVGEYAYTWCTSTRRIFSVCLATLGFQPPATNFPCLGLGPYLCPTVCGGHKKVL
jgi:hypothetical protein